MRRKIDAEAAARQRWQHKSRQSPEDTRGVAEATRPLHPLRQRSRASLAALQDWCRFSAATTAYIEPGAPCQNPYAEPYTGHLRREL